MKDKINIIFVADKISRAHKKQASVFDTEVLFLENKDTDNSYWTSLQNIDVNKKNVIFFDDIKFIKKEVMEQITNLQDFVVSCKNCKGKDFVGIINCQGKFSNFSYKEKEKWMNIAVIGKENAKLYLELSKKEKWYNKALPFEIICQLNLDVIKYESFMSV